MKRHQFFKRAAVAICGSLQIDKAVQNCLSVIQDYMPADYLSLHLLDDGLGVIETVADVGPDRNGPVSHKTVIPAGVRRLLEKDAHNPKNVPTVIRIDRLCDSFQYQQIGLELGTPDDACLIMDLVLDGSFLGAVAVTAAHEQLFTEEHAELLASLHDPFAISLSNFIRFREVNELKNLLTERNRFLQSEMMRQAGGEVIGADFGLRNVMEKVRQVAPISSPVLLLGETGVGKEVIARSIHLFSSRQDEPFIKINCGAIPPSLVDSELFGHEKGAFTGASERRKGYFERAHQGTIFLDEIGELTLDNQLRLLRVLQEGVIERIGGKEPIYLDLRVIAATHRDLPSMVKEGGFRQDLFYRINVFPIIIPPLRERMTDIPALVTHFIRKKAPKIGLNDIPQVAPGAIDYLMDYEWPGNIRELENVVERELIIRQGGPLTFEQATPRSAAVQDSMWLYNDNDSLELDHAMRRHIDIVLGKTNGKISGSGGAAELLGIHPRTLAHRMKKLGIQFGREVKGLYHDDMAGSH